MIANIPSSQTPQWLADINCEADMATFPHVHCLRSSFYYPSSGFDGRPIRHLAGNFHSFVYADYGMTATELDVVLDSPGFRGYEVVGQRQLPELLPAPNRIFAGLSESERRRFDQNSDWIKEPFCRWIVLRRNSEYRDEHGPEKFSLLYLCADGIASFEALWRDRTLVPAGIAIIQPGHAFGGNWTNFTDPSGPLAQAVFHNPAGRPQYLLYGGIDRRNAYRTTCWPDYGDFICFLGSDNIGMWRCSRTEKRTP